MMRSFLFLLLLLCSLNLFADEPDNFVEPILQIDTVKEEKILKCVDEYIKKQSKSYAKVVQADLYALIHNFDSIIARIYGKKSLPDDISYADKIALLAKVQCDAYYKMGVLK